MITTTASDVKQKGNFFKNRHLRPVLVTILIAILFLLPEVWSFSRRDGALERWDFLWIVIPLCSLAVFYINYFYILPKAFSDRSSVKFLVRNLFLMCVFIFSSVWVADSVHKRMVSGRGQMPPAKEFRHGKNPHRGPGPHRDRGVEMHFIFRDLVYFFLSIALAYALRANEERSRMRERRLQSEANSKAMELKYLRTQLNPHFLFNTLNNIYALTAISPTRAQKAIHELSAMLRYLIYETNVNKVPLRRELEVVNDYLALSRLRLDSSFNLKVHLPVVRSDSFLVPPLVMLTLVENAFKHCDKTSPDAFINVEMLANDSGLKLTVSNSYLPKENVTKVKESSGGHGIGLVNIRQ